MATRSERDAAASKVARLDAELEKVTDNLRSVEVERESYRVELDSTRSGLERTKKHVGVIQEKAEKLRGENATLKVKLGLAPEAAG